MTIPQKPSGDPMPTQFESDCRFAKYYLRVLEQDNKTYEAGSATALEALADFDNRMLPLILQTKPSDVRKWH